MGGGDADTGDAAARQRPTGHGHLVGEDPRGTNNLSTVEHRQRSVKLERLFGDGELFVGGERSAEGPPQQGAIGALLLGPDGPERKPCRYVYRWTSARARQGLPDPFTSFSGATTSTAPVAGSLARLASCVSPYLLAPSRNW